MSTKEFPTVEATVDAIKADIIELIQDGTVPATVTSFSELHDYIDANMLGDRIFPDVDWNDDDAVEAYMDTVIGILSPAQHAVDAWLAAGRH